MGRGVYEDLPAIRESGRDGLLSPMKPTDVNQSGSIVSDLVRNLRVVQVLPDDNAILVEGAVPGPDGGYVVVR